MAHAAFDSALQLAKTGQYLWCVLRRHHHNRRFLTCVHPLRFCVRSEALVVRARALAGRAAGCVGGHWGEAEAQKRLEEVISRLAGGAAGLGGQAMAL